MASKEYRVKIHTVTMSNPDGFGIAKVKFDESPSDRDCPVSASAIFGAKGQLGDIQPGDVLEVQGTWTRHATYGWQLAVGAAVQAVAVSDAALYGFLQRFPNVGPKRATAIMQQFGGREAVCEIIEKAPERLAEVQGITKERAAEIHDAFVKAAGIKEVLFFVDGLDLAKAHRNKVVQEWEMDAKSIILEDPYALMAIDGISFGIADKAAAKLGVRGEDPRRLAAATADLLDKAAREGHTWSTVEDLMRLQKKNRY